MPKDIIITFQPFAQGICLGSIFTFIVCVAVVGVLMWYANKKKKGAVLNG